MHESFIIIVECDEILELLVNICQNELKHNCDLECFLCGPQRSDGSTADSLILLINIRTFEIVLCLITCNFINVFFYIGTIGMSFSKF